MILVDKLNTQGVHKRFAYKTNYIVDCYYSSEGDFFLDKYEFKLPIKRSVILTILKKMNIQLI